MGGLGTAALIMRVSRSENFSVNRMILVGIGAQAMLSAVINYIILKTSDYDLSTALHWLSGSLNGVRMNDLPVFAVITLLCVLLLLSMGRDISLLGLGEELPVTLGMRVARSRSVLICCAVLLCASSTAVTGPLASVAFMSGPIAQRILRTGGTGTLHAGMTGAVIVMISETIGQFAFATRYPVGVITGIIGAPYLIWLLIRTNRRQG